MTRRRLFAALASVVGLLVLIGSAWAYFSTLGSGTAAGGVGTLTAPAAPSVPASVTGNNVSVSWTGIAPPTSPNVAYWVRRYVGATASDACGTTATAPLFAGTGAKSCNDTPVVTGTYTYTVTAVWRSFNAESASSGTVAVQTAPAQPTLTASGPASARPGNPIPASAITATIAGGSSPSGNLAFRVFGPQSTAPSACTSGGSTVGGAVSVAGNGTYSPSAAFTPSASGTYWWYASYGGDANNAGAASTCGAAMSATTVSSAYAWGLNTNGQLGDGTTTSPRTSPVPVGLPAGVTATAVSAGGGHSLAVTPTGAVYAWGSNSSGQLGDNTVVPTQRTSPVLVNLPGGVVATAVSAGSNHSLAVTSTGAVYAWGSNSSGQLGDGTVTKRISPVLVNLPGGVVATAVSAGSNHSLAVTSTGAVYAWGWNGDGQLGDGTITDRTSPVLVGLPGGVVATAVSGGYYHSLALTSTGAVYAWGFNGIDDSTSPVLVGLPAGVTATAVSAGGGHSLALTSTGAVYSWGFNNNGQLGDGTTTQRTSPVLVGLPGGVVATAVSAGNSHSLTLTSTGAVYAWGLNGNGQLGDGTTTQRTSPVLVNLPAGVVANAVSAGGSHSLAVTSPRLTTSALAVAGAGTAIPRTAISAAFAGAATTGTITFTVFGPQPSAPSTCTSGGTTVGTATVAGNGTYNPSAAFLPPSTGTYWWYASYGGDANNAAAASTCGAGMALTNVRSAYAWGNNGSGQLGDGTVTQRTSPVPVGLPAGVTATAVSAGANHILAVTSTGAVYAWGSNGNGQLGDGSTTNRTSPVLVGLPAGATATAVSAGTFHSLALTSTGAVYAWGFNGTTGRLGDGTTTQRTSPVLVNLPAGVTATAVSAGNAHSLAVTSTGAVYAWGSNGNGQLGDATVTARTSPVLVGLPAGVTATAVRGGSDHSLAATSTGAVYAWGYNGNGQLGDGTVTQRTSPVLVSLPAGVTATAVSAGAGGNHSLAATSTGAVYAWGLNTNGQLGVGDTAQRNSPVLVGLPAGVTATAVSAGTSHSLAATSTGVVYAWGLNTNGQLGDGSVTQRTSPVLVGLPAGLAATAVSAGTSHSLAVTSPRLTSSAPAVAAAGTAIPASGVRAALAGAASPTGTISFRVFGPQASPPTVCTSGGTTVGGAVGVAGNGTYQASAGFLPPNAGTYWWYASYGGDANNAAASTCGAGMALTNVRSAYAWGSNASGQLGDGTTTNRTSPVPVGLPSGVTATAVSGGDSHSLAVTSTGAVYAWGRNSSGQLGDGSITDRTSAVLVGLPAGVTATAVSAGGNHSLALTSTGAVYAWGDNAFGQLGDASTTQRTSPVLVGLPAGVTATAVSAGANHSLVVTSTGAVYAWGFNGSGQLGDASTTNRTSPVPVGLPGGVTATAVSAGSSHSLVVTSTGAVYAWGLNTNGQLGDGSTTQRTSPVLVGLPAGVTATAVSAGAGFHSLALTSTGAVYTWGANGNGQLGDGTTTQRISPVLVNLPAGVTATAVSAGNSHSLALTSTGAVYAWGLNGNGQLGDGTTTQRTSPVLVNLPAGVTASAVSAGTLHSFALTSR